MKDVVADITSKHVLPERISARKNSEEEARSLLIKTLGHINQDQLIKFFQIVDRDNLEGKSKQGRFGVTFQGANSKLICDQLEKVNEWIKAFWEVAEEDAYVLIDRFMKMKPIKGAGAGFPSLLLYLRDPDKFNIWLTVMVQGLNSIENGEFSGSSGEVYRKYNEALIHFRKKYKLEPQALDIVVTVINNEHSAPDIERKKRLAILKADFLKRAEGFVSFVEPGVKLQENEINYKRAANQKIHELLVPYVQGTATILDDEDGKNLLGKMFGLTNFLNWRDLSYLSEELLSAPGRWKDYADRVIALLVGIENGEWENKLSELLDWLNQISCKANISKIITTYPLFLWDPSEHIFIKPSKTDQFLKSLGEKHLGEGKLLSVEGYKQLLGLCTWLREVGLEDWHPQDNIDIHSFLWVVTGGWNDAGAQESSPEVEFLSQSTAQQDPVTKSVIGQNLILYGPPGTGKTYRLTQLFEEFTSNSTGESEASYLSRLVEDKPWWQIVAAAVLDSQKVKVPALLRHPLIQAKLAQTSIKSPNARLWSSLQSHSVQGCPHVNYQNKIEPSIFWKDIDSIWSVKEDLLQELAPEVIELKNKSKQIPSTETIKRYEFVTFHQSYGYEEFVEGIRPVMEEDVDGEVQYRIEPGIFKKICTRAEGDLGHQYAIFIDEINRGNISKIFGELITLVELDKRLENGNGMRIRLPYSQKEFGVPSNLSIIGTMNTADRSIAFIDIALRRRFQFKEMMPELDVIEREIGTIEGVSVKDLLFKINRRIEFLYDRDHVIGHSYFLKCQTLTDLKVVILENIIPLLQEYFYGDWEKICLVLGCGTSGNGAVQTNAAPVIKAEKLDEKEILGFDHLDYEDSWRYEVNPDFIGASGEGLQSFLLGIVASKKSIGTQSAE